MPRRTFQHFQPVFSFFLSFLFTMTTPKNCILKKVSDHRFKKFQSCLSSFPEEAMFSQNNIFALFHKAETTTMVASNKELYFLPLMKRNNLVRLQFLCPINFQLNVENIRGLVDQFYFLSKFNLRLHTMKTTYLFAAISFN